MVNKASYKRIIMTLSSGLSLLY